MPTTRTSASVATLVGLLTLSLAACGGSDAATSTSTPVAGSGSVASSQPSTTSPQTTTSTKAPTKTILELATNEGSLSTLLRLLDVAGLTPTLEGSGPFTLMAPTDGAFAKMDPATLDRFEKNPDALKSLLQYHVVGKRISTTDVDSGFVATAEGSNLLLTGTSGLPTVNGLTVKKGAKATNGTILVIESVLLPVDLKLP